MLRNISNNYFNVFNHFLAERLLNDPILGIDFHWVFTLYEHTIKECKSKYWEKWRYIYIDNITWCFQYPPWYFTKVPSICPRPKAEGKYGTEAKYQGGYLKYQVILYLLHTCTVFDSCKILSIIK